MRNDHVTAFDLLQPALNGGLGQCGTGVSIDGKASDLEAQFVDFSHRLRIVNASGTSIPVRCHANCGFNGLGTCQHFTAQVHHVRLAGNAVDLAACPNHGRNVVFTMILHVQQIQVGFDHGNTIWVLVEPFFGGKEGGRDFVANQKLNQVAVVFATAGIQRQCDALRRTRHGHKQVVDFDQALLAPGHLQGQRQHPGSHQALHG